MLLEYRLIYRFPASESAGDIPYARLHFAATPEICDPILTALLQKWRKHYVEFLEQKNRLMRVQNDLEEQYDEIRNCEDASDADIERMMRLGVEISLIKKQYNAVVVEISVLEKKIGGLDA